MDQHISILSVVFIVFGILGIVAAVLFFFLGAGTAATILTSSHGEPDARVGAAWAGGCMTFIAAMFGLLSIPSILTGWGLAKRKSWSRIMAIVLGILSLPHFPIGTAVGVYALVIMFNDETKVLLNA